MSGGTRRGLESLQWRGHRCSYFVICSPIEECCASASPSGISASRSLRINGGVVVERRDVVLQGLVLPRIEGQKNWTGARKSPRSMCVDRVARRHVRGAIDEWLLRSRRGVVRSARPECPMLEMRISCALSSTVIIHRLFFQSHHEVSCISPVPATPANIHSSRFLSWCFAASDARTASANARPFQSAIVELLRRERLGAPFCRSCKLASASVLKETRESSAACRAGSKDAG